LIFEGLLLLLSIPICVSLAWTGLLTYVIYGNYLEQVGGSEMLPLMATQISNTTQTVCVVLGDALLVNIQLLHIEEQDIY
jgi:hypothetical protein